MLSDTNPVTSAKSGLRLANFDIGRDKVNRSWITLTTSKSNDQLPLTTYPHIDPISAARAQLSLTQRSLVIEVKIFVALTNGTRVRPSNWYWQRGSKQRLLGINAMTLMSSIHSLVCNNFKLTYCQALVPIPKSQIFPVLFQQSPNKLKSD